VKRSSSVNIQLAWQTIADSSKGTDWMKSVELLPKPAVYRFTRYTDGVAKKVYIGQSSNVRERFGKYRRECKKPGGFKRKVWEQEARIAGFIERSEEVHFEIIDETQGLILDGASFELGNEFARLAIENLAILEAEILGLLVANKNQEVKKLAKKLRELV